MKPGATRFTLKDVSGNCIIFINNGKRDQQIWEKAEDKKQTPLQQSIATAIRFRDFKEDEKAAAKTSDIALKKVNKEPVQEIAEALLIRMDLAITRNDLNRREECRILISQLRLPEEQIARLAQKHDIKADFDF
nr:hypothetical protein [Pedobacter sp. ASV2]